MNQDICKTCSKPQNNNKCCLPKMTPTLKALCVHLDRLTDNTDLLLKLAHKLDRRQRFSR